MAQDVKIAFERRIVVVPLTEILPVRQISADLKQMLKYRRIVASIAEVGIVEPLVVARKPKNTGTYMLLDGHLRHAALIDLGRTEAPCVIADDDEAFTYNKRVSRLATVQEHFMIARAIERGVSEEKLAKALNIDIKLIKQKRSLLEGICPELVEQLKDRSIDPTVFNSLRKMKPMRQIEAVELMSASENFTSRYAQALLAATKQQDLARPDRPKKIRGMTAEQIARMEREMEELQRDFKRIEASYGDSVLNLVVVCGYVSKLIKNARTCRYLEQHHSELLTEFKSIVAAASLDDGGAKKADIPAAAE